MSVHNVRLLRYARQKNTEENIRVALDYMIGLPGIKIKKEINTIYNLLDDLLEYLNTAGKVVRKLNTMNIPKYIIQAFSLAWQARKNAVKAKKPERLAENVVGYRK